MRRLSLTARLAIAGLAIGASMLSAASPTGPFGLLALPYATMGAILIIRRPRTLIGWLLIGLALCFSLISVPVTGTPQEYADGTVDLAVAVFAVIHTGLGTTAFFLFAVLVMVFPSGRLPGGRWGQAARAALGVAVVFVAAAYVVPEIYAGFPVDAVVRNPAAVLPDLAIWDVVNSITVIFPVLIVVLLGAASLVVRVRRAVGTERQQLRWIAAAFVALTATVSFGVVIGFLVPGAGASGVAWFPAMVAFPTIPIAIGIAVMRYRLYDIDRIISRTIGYAVVTAVLAAVFLAINLVLQTWVAGVTGGSTVAVAVTTLLTAALFQPLRRVTQAPIDRRFNRARVDAERSLASFGSWVREEVDLARLSGAVLMTADEAVRPAGAGLWLRGAAK